MEKLHYEKPAMKIVSLRSKTAVAGNCWSDEASSGGKTWYYDTEGKGYVEFTLSHNCSGNVSDLTGYEAHNYETQEAADAAIAELKARLKNDLKQNLVSAKDIEDDITKVS